MTDNSSDFLSRFGERGWIRLRTQIVLRWIAIGGQLVTIVTAQVLLDLQIELGWAYFVIGLSAIANLVVSFVFPENKRMSEQENMSMVMIDVLQLSCLLYLTGGLNNPFAVLLPWPVIVAAKVSDRRSTVLVGLLTIASTSVLAFFHFPIVTQDGRVLEMPQVFVYGIWVAISIAVVFLGFYARRLSEEMNSMADALAATQMALAREQKLTDLGGVVAAAAHELGTPLATIKLASAELADELTDESLREDAELIREQADRCRDILRDMGRAGKDDLHMRQVPISALLREAAEPHSQRGVELKFTETPMQETHAQQPLVLRRPEIIHGLRNLMQNAVDFARVTVSIETRWDHDHIILRIVDDGPGYPSHVLGRLGDPFLRPRRDLTEAPNREGYEGMGLGLFIAKTLLERSGAEVTFANRRRRSDGVSPVQTGAIVQVRWPRKLIEQDSSIVYGADNVPLI